MINPLKPGIAALCAVAVVLALIQVPATAHQVIADVAAVSTPDPQVPAATSGTQLWTVRMGTTTLVFDQDASAERSIRIGLPADMDQPSPTFKIDPASTLSFSVADGSLGEIVDGRILHFKGLSVFAGANEYNLGRLEVAPMSNQTFDASWVAASLPGGAAGLLMCRVKANFDPGTQTLTIWSPELRVSPALAELMGDPQIADVVLGTVTVRGTAVWTGGADPRESDLAPFDGVHTAGVIGPDMTFCQLYDMKQYGRLVDVVGLAEATTSWNVGDEDLMWWPIPDEEHPFIVMNSFRLKDDRLEQIGMSHIKHGFYALGSHQCGGPSCGFQPGHSAGRWLGTGCTDTYSSSLNAVQSGMGPRFEVNPWTGVWLYEGSHMVGSHTHDAVQHRLQVHDVDLDPAMNPGATYYGEGYYVILDDVDVMNSASWKPFTVSGSPGGTWSLSMSGSSTYPNIGFAIDAWPDAQKTIVAQEVPVIEFESPDGRCILGAKATDLGGGVYHYEYALYNVDMDRQVGSFSVPVPAGASVTNVGFHAVEHHNEPLNEPGGVPIDNSPWAAEVAGGSCSWSTTTNPLRWGMMYNFRFDADVPPATGTITVGLFKPGDPSSVDAETVVPAGGCASTAACPNADVNCDDVADGFDIAVVRAPGNWLFSPAEADEPRADVNGDGIIDGFDIAVIRSGACWLQ